MEPVLLPEAFLRVSSTLIDLTVMLSLLPPPPLLPLASSLFLPLTGERDGAWCRGGRVAGRGSVCSVWHLWQRDKCFLCVFLVILRRSG